MAACGLLVCLLSPAQAFSSSSDAPPGAVELASKQAQALAEITFSGYQSLPGGRGLLFVEVTELVPVEVKRAGQVIEYKLMGARVPLRNNKNPLLLRDFSSSALSAVLVPDKQAVRLIVTLRASVNPAHRMVTRGKGAMLEIDLPPLAGTAK